jgi:hypothetical protein
MKTLVAALTLALLATTAQAQDMQLQWQRDPALSLRGLIDQGFEIKAVLESHAPLEDAQSETLTYVLQHGKDVYRCIEWSVTAKGTMLSSQAYCLRLVPPYDGKATKAG